MHPEKQGLKIDIKRESLMGGMSCGEVSLVPWEILKNSVTLISGKSGNGKSTLIDILTGLQKPSSGNIYYDNINLNEFDLQTTATWVAIRVCLYHYGVVNRIVLDLLPTHERNVVYLAMTL